MSKFKGIFVFCVALLFMALLPTIALAKDSDKTYPITGKIVGKGENGQVVGTGNGQTATLHFHAYKIVTDSRVYVLEFDKRSFFSTTGKELGGHKPLDIGDTISFRIEKKDKAYVQLPDGKEEKVRLVSEEAK